MLSRCDAYKFQTEFDACILERLDPAMYVQVHHIHNMYI